MSDKHQPSARADGVRGAQEIVTGAFATLVAWAAGRSRGDRLLVGQPCPTVTLVMGPARTGKSAFIQRLGKAQTDFVIVEWEMNDER